MSLSTMKMHFPLILVSIALFFTQLAASLPRSSSLYKRASSSMIAVSTIDIPLYFDQNGRYVVPIGMAGSSADQQHFNFTLATSTGLTAVAGTGCSSCSGIDLYNESASDTAEPLKSSDNVTLVDSAFGGSVIKENCSMATADSSSWVYKNQTIIVVNSQDNGTVFVDGVSGIVGLGTNRFASTTTSSNYTPSFDDTIYNMWLRDNPDAAAFQFGMDIAAPVATPTSVSAISSAAATSTAGSGASAGTLHWLAPDSSAYDASTLTTKTVESNSSTVYASLIEGQPDWSVLLDGWSFKSGSETISFEEDMMTNVEPYFTDIYFPLDKAELLNAGITGSVQQTNLSTLSSTAVAWTVPCDAEFTFTVSINDQNYSLDQSVLVITLEDGTCASGIEGWADESVDEYLFGALFISQFYVIFTVGRNGTDSISFAPKAIVKKSSNVGAIVGGTLGGVVGALLLVAAMFFYMRARRAHATLHKVVEEHKNATTVEPYMVTLPTHAASTAVPSPMTSEFSPPSSPGAALLVHGIEQDDVLPPPSYEVSQNARGSVGPPPTARTRKGEYVGVMTVHASVEGSGSTSNAGMEQQPLAPNRAYTIEE